MTSSARTSMHKARIRLVGILAPALLVVSGETEPACAQGPQARAGNPECIARYAQRSDCGPYSGSFVGGSCAFKGHARRTHEGVWGWDYCGPLRSEHPWLKWCRGRRCQGGTGAYKTDGPHVPDPLAKLRL